MRQKQNPLRCFPALIASVLVLSFGLTGPAAAADMSDVALLGKQLFNDPILSSTGKMACATCHDAKFAHAAPNTRSVPEGADPGREAGRQSPSLRYLKFNTSFFFAKDGTPTGGFTWDGRAMSLADQARGPLLSPNEMANKSVDDVVGKLARSNSAAEFKRLFGSDIFNRPADAFARLLLSLQKYQKEDPDFAPFSSKFDQWLNGRATLSSAEIRGWALFNNPNKGNCASCHVSTSVNGVPPLFTDFTYDNLGLPRNPEIKANADFNYFDLGICGPSRTDLANRGDLCGAFKVPTLRNVAKTAPYFHNGVIKTLREAVKFYATRDTNPELWYPAGQKFNDLPSQYQRNVNTTEVPYNRVAGDYPALDDNEIDDVVAFLNTLTDAN